MSDNFTAESEESLFKRQRSYIGDNLAHEQIGDNAPSTYSASLHSALSTRGLGSRGNGEMTVETMRGAQATYGNRAVQRYLGGRRSAISGQVSIQRWPSFIKPYMDQILGKEPDKQEEQDKPERKPRGPVYAGENEAGGYEQGMEGVTGSSSIFGIPISVIFGQSQLQAGRWGESGARRSGFKAEGELLRTTINGGST